MTATISVVIPLYNKAPHIKRAIDSVLAQTHQPDEIIIIDDGSTDGGGDVVKRIKDHRLRYNYQENQGASAARNHGIALAKGELIGFLDADDAWKEEYLKTIITMREIYPAAGAYATAFDIISPDGSLIKLNFKVLPPGMEHQLLDNIFKNAIPQPLHTSAIVVTKKVFDEIGGFAVGEIHAEDLDMWFRIGIKHPIAWNRKALSTYHLDASNRTYGVKPITCEPGFCFTVREALKIGNVPNHITNDVKEYVAYWNCYFVRRLIYSNNQRVARKLMNEIKVTQFYNYKVKIIYLICCFLSCLPNSIAKSILYLSSKVNQIRYKIISLH